MTQFESRYARAAQANYPQFVSDVYTKYGFSPQNVSRLLALAGRLGTPEGYRLTDADAALLKELHPQTRPQDIDSLVQALNAEPARVRQDAFIGTLASDTNTMRGDVHLSSDATKHVKALVYESEVQDIAARINAKRGGSADASPAYKPPPGSIREAIESQVEGPVARDFRERYERDDPDAVHAAAWATAAVLDNARERLGHGNDLSTRDTVAAAWDAAYAENTAEQDFGVTGEDQ